VKALLPLLVIDLLLFTALGIAVIAWLPRPWCGHLLVGAPALGAAALVVALHLTSLVVDVRVGTVIVLVTAVASLVARSSRCHWWRQVGRSSWLLLVGALIAGAIPLIFVIQPFRAAGATVVQPAGNNDAFYYVSLTDWLLEHSALTVPVIGVDPPAYGNARYTLQQGLRLGEEMNEGAVATITGNDPIATWSTTTIMWLFFIPGACMAAFEVLRLNRGAGVLAGVLTAGSAVVAIQVLNQNSSAMLGILIAPLAIALWAGYFARRGGGQREPGGELTAAVAVGDAPAGVSSTASERPPLWLAVLVFDALVGSYTEYLPIVGVGLLLYLALRPPRQWLRTLVDALKFGALAVALGPLIWYDAERSLRATSTLGGDYGSPFLGVPVRTWIARLTGASPYDARTGLTLGVILAAWLIVGIVLAMLWSPARTILACVLLNFVVVALLLGSGYHYFPYAEYRAVGMGVSLLVLTSVAGWAAGLQRLSRSARGRPLLSPGLAAVAVPAALFFVLNQQTLAKQALVQDWSPRTVTSDFNQGAAWAASVDGQGGSNVTALVPEFFTQLWAMYALRKSPQINFPFLYSDYAQVPPLTYDDGRLRRYVLLGGDCFSQIDPTAVVGGNARFRYLDVSRGRVVLAVGVQNAQNIEVTPQRVQQWMVNGGRLLVVHTSDVHSVTLTLTANPVLASVPVTISADGGAGQDYVVGHTDLTVTIPLGSSRMSLIKIDNHVLAVSPSPDDPRPLSVLVEAVRAG
jgi:hypothetical protein